MFKQIVAILAVTAFVAAIPVEQAHSYSSIERHESKSVPIKVEGNPKYDYKYGVEDHHTGDKKSLSESRDGDKVKGEYSVVQPDGTVRKVEYSSDHKTGFNADVTYSGHAVHPQEVKKAPEHHH